MPSLPDNPSLEWLRKQAKHRLDDLQRDNPAAQLAEAQLALAREYGFPSWRALKAHVDGLTVDGQMFEAARSGDLATLARLLDAHPDRLYARAQPYEWTLLHTAAAGGHPAVVAELLKHGLDPNTREKGDNTYAMHWAAAAGRADIVRQLADAGGDVIGAGDDHQGEVIGWATMWDGCDDAAHGAVVDFLVSRGARHHIYSAIAMNLAGEVRRIVAADPAALNQRQSRNENNRMPLHFAVQMKKPEMAALLLELGADPLAVDAAGQSAALYSQTPDADRPVMEKIARIVSAEFESAARGSRPPRGGPMDLAALLSIRDWDRAESLLRANPPLIEPSAGVLHLMAQRNDTDAASWLLAQGAPVNGLWSSDGPLATPLHLAAARGHVAMLRLLLDAGADRTIHDSQHDSDPLGWAEFFKQPETAELLRKVP